MHASFGLAQAQRQPGAGRRAAIALTVLAGAALLILCPLKLCFFALTLGVPCPGCGMTRAALAMLTGEFARAVAWNPLALVMVPYTGWVVSRHAAAYVRTGDAWRGVVPRRGESAAVTFALLLLVALWGARFFGWFGGPVPV